MIYVPHSLHRVRPTWWWLGPSCAIPTWLEGGKASYDLALSHFPDNSFGIYETRKGNLSAYCALRYGFNTLRGLRHEQPSMESRIEMNPNSFEGQKPIHQITQLAPRSRK